MSDKRRLRRCLSITMVSSLVAFFCLIITFLLTALLVPKTWVSPRWFYYWSGAAVLIVSINLLAKFFHRRLISR